MKNIIIIKKLLLAGLLPVFIAFGVNAQLSVNGGLSGQQLADLLTASGLEITNVTLSCPGSASGSFSNGNSTNIGIDAGVLLTSGCINNAPGPNSETDATCDNGGAGDADLQALTTTQTYDACYLQFDVVPVGNTISFNYTFASEEYEEFFCSSFNDVFGFLVSGPNPGGGSYINHNIALVPGSSTPVAINNVGPGSCNGINNSGLYNNNDGGATIEYDGFTDVFTATIAVERCQTYTFKLGIADAGDPILDSGVFIEEGSFASNEILASAEVINSDCPGGRDGSIDLTIEGGVEPYSYNWSTGDTGQDLMDLPPGNYSVTITDADGCTQEESFTVLPGSDTEAPSVTCSDMTVELDENGNADLTLPVKGNLPAVVKGVGGFCPNVAVPALCCDCPPGYVAVGYEGLVGNGYGNVISQYSLICRELNPDGSMGATSTTTCSNGLLVAGASTGAVTAGPGQVLVGADYRMGCAMDRLRGFSMSIADVLSSGDNTSSSPMTAIGGLGGGVRPAQYVPDGSVIVGMQTYIDPRPGGLNEICAGVAWRYATLQSVINASNFNYSDNCCIQSAVLNESMFSCESVGTNDGITLVVTDESGNSNDCQFTITVEDNIPPDAVCQDITVNLDENGMASISDDEIDGGSSDACGIATWSTDIKSFDCADAYEYLQNGTTITATLTLTDFNGNVSECTGEITVLYSGQDGDCDGVGDECDICEYGDDSVDFSGPDGVPDGIPDCSQLLESYHPDWMCGNNNRKVLICHVPPGNPANRHETCVSINALPAHFNNHGDPVGPCSGCDDAFVVDQEDLVIGSHEEFQVYPNPATDRLVITHSSFEMGSANVRVTNSSGMLLWSYQQGQDEKAHNYTINLNNYSTFTAGVYFVTVIHGADIDTKKVLIF